MNACDRQAIASINLANLRSNLRRVRESAPGCKVYAALKANAYGHGAVPAARALSRTDGQSDGQEDGQADGLAVASLDEARALRDSGLVNQPIMLLSMSLDSAILDQCAQLDLAPVVFDETQLPALEDYRGDSLCVWVKLDTGMHRLGLPASRARQAFYRLQKLASIDVGGWLTHLACADDVRDDFTRQQIAQFEQALQGVPGLRSLANSAGILAWPDTHADIVRPGIMLYGASPLLHRTAADLGLRPVMTLTAPIISVRDVPAGEGVGYGADWRATTDSRIAVVAIGYGDGYPRRARNDTPVLVNGQRCSLVGRVSMDMITVDVSACEQLRIGDRATLWGEGLPADEVARSCDTIAYELFCQLTDRVKFEYIDSDSPR